MTANDDVHDRTHMLAEQLGIGLDAMRRLTSRRVVLELSRDAARTDVGKLAFLTLCNLTARLGPYVPHLDVAVPADTAPLVSPIYSEGGSSLTDQALWTVRTVVPTAGLVRKEATSLTTYDLAISIGEPSISARERVRVGWNNWLAIVGDDASAVAVGNDTNPLGALLAAAIATARLHALQLISVGAKIELPPATSRLNALTLDEHAGGEPLVLGGINLPPLLLIGAGALASAFSYAMTHVQGLSASVDALDHDILKRTNANRQVTAPFARAESEKTLKVDDLAACWPAVRPIPLKYNDFKLEHGRSASDYEIAVTAVDNAEARREVAKDLPRVVIDGATGGLMVALMRGADPAASCVACAYAEVVTDIDGIWSRRLGFSREQVGMLRNGVVPFDDDVVRHIKCEGTLLVDEEVEDGLRREGWAYLERARCGNAQPDRDLPSASVSYVSAICGFLMAAQTLAELLGVPTLTGPSRWVWTDVLRDLPQAAEREDAMLSSACAARHTRRSEFYRNKWPRNQTIGVQSNCGTDAHR